MSDEKIVARSNWAMKTVNCRMLFLALVLCLVVSPLFAAESPGASALSTAVNPLLRDWAVRCLQQINDARRDPLTAARRLGVDAQDVRNFFQQIGENPEQGLAPLAWNNTLRLSAENHGRDMLTRFYYDYTSPEGVTVEGRIAEQGYQALFVGEVLGALVFDDFVDIDWAMSAMLDALLRAELLGQAPVEASIFSPEVSEVGITIFAETVDFLAGHPYVYLFIADFASPVEDRSSLLVTLDPHQSFVFRVEGEGSINLPQLLRPGFAQIPQPEADGEIVVYDAAGDKPIVLRTYDYDKPFPSVNVSLDLRTSGTIVGK